MSTECYYCGEEVHEGRMVCWICEHKDDDKEPVEWDGSGD